MFYGTGKIAVKLLGANGQTLSTIVLPRPNAREFEDFEPAILNLGTDLNNEPIEILQGYRFRGVYKFTGSSANQTEMAQLMLIGNHRGFFPGSSRAEKVVRLWPHEDQPGIRIICRVKQEQKPIMGMIYGDEITLTFEGIERLPQKPNPTYDVTCQLFGHEHVVTAEVFGS